MKKCGIATSSDKWVRLSGRRSIRGEGHFSCVGLSLCAFRERAPVGKRR